MVNIVNLIRFNILLEVCFVFQPPGECPLWWTRESPMGQVAKFYGRRRLIRTVWKALTFSVFKILMEF